MSEVLFGNGGILAKVGYENRVLTYDPASNTFMDDTSFGFNFEGHPDLTSDIDCADMDGDGTVDFVLIGNIGERNILYRNTRGSL